MSGSTQRQLSLEQRPRGLQPKRLPLGMLQAAAGVSRGHYLASPSPPSPPPAYDKCPNSQDFCPRPVCRPGEPPTEVKQGPELGSPGPEPPAGVGTAAQRRVGASPPPARDLARGQGSRDDAWCSQKSNVRREASPQARSWVLAESRGQNVPTLVFPSFRKKSCSGEAHGELEGNLPRSPNHATLDKPHPTLWGPLRAQCADQRAFCKLSLSSQGEKQSTKRDLKCLLIGSLIWAWNVSQSQGIQQKEHYMGCDITSIPLPGRVRSRELCCVAPPLWVSSTSPGPELGRPRASAPSARGLRAHSRAAWAGRQVLVSHGPEFESTTPVTHSHRRGFRVSKTPSLPCGIIMETLKKVV